MNESGSAWSSAIERCAGEREEGQNNRSTKKNNMVRGLPNESCGEFVATGSLRPTQTHATRWQQRFFRGVTPQCPGGQSLGDPRTTWEHATATNPCRRAESPSQHAPRRHSHVPVSKRFPVSNRGNNRVFGSPVAGILMPMFRLNLFASRTGSGPVGSVSQLRTKKLRVTRNYLPGHW